MDYRGTLLGFLGGKERFGGNRDAFADKHKV